MYEKLAKKFKQGLSQLQIFTEVILHLHSNAKFHFFYLHL